MGLMSSLSVSTNAMDFMMNIGTGLVSSLSVSTNVKDERVTREFIEDYYQCNPYELCHTVEEFMNNLKKQQKKSDNIHLLTKLNIDLRHIQNKENIKKIEFPPSIAQLTHLTTLNCLYSDINIHGHNQTPLLSLPQEFYQLTNLSTLEI